jgi:hypothetical protein
MLPPPDAMATSVAIILLAAVRYSLRMGWAARRNRLRRHLGARPVDERECQRVAGSLRASVAHYGLTLHPAAVLSRMIAVADRGARDGVVATQDDEQVRLLGQAQHVADCLDRFRHVADHGDVVRWVKKSLDRINTPTSEALDYLLEIEVGGRLAEQGLFQVATGEPDIVATCAAGSLTCACKHPGSLTGAAKRIVEAAKQIVKQGHIGIVVVSLDSVFHETGKYLGVAQPDDAAEWGKAQLDVAEKECHGAIAKAWRAGPQVAGVIFLLAVPYVSKGPPRTAGFRRVGRAVARPSVSGSLVFVRTVAQVLMGGLTQEVRED